MLRKIRLIVTGIVVLLIISCMLGVLGLGDMPVGILERITAFVFALIFSMVLYVIIYYWYGNDYKCPSCNKRFCLKKEGTDVVDKKSVSVRVLNNIRNRNGEVTGTLEQYVPGERITYQINYVCKKCGEGCHSTYEKDVPKV